MPTSTPVIANSSELSDSPFDASDAPTLDEARMVVARLSRGSVTLAAGMFLTDEDMQVERAKRIARVHNRVVWAR
jgi:hypothetical protein